METYQTKVGQPLEISFESFPGSGAIWYLQTALPNGCRITQKDARETDGGIGGGATQIFLLECAEAAEFELEFILKRVWEKTVRNSRRILIKAKS
jgi:predicted secreted protein